MPMPSTPIDPVERLRGVDLRVLVPGALVAYQADRYLTLRCLWHQDRKPSCLVYADGYRCLSCGARGGAISLYMGIHKCDREAAIRELTRLLDAGELPAAPEQVERAPVAPPRDLGLRLHAGLTDEAVRYYVEDRGFDLETIAEYQLGYGRLREDGPAGYTVPVYWGGRLVQVKLRIPDATGNKYRSVEGAGSWLYLGEDCSWSNLVILCEGEFDAIALRQQGFRACTGTGGVRRFDPAWLRHLEGSTVYCCYDTDDAGELGYLQLRETFGRAIKRIRLEGAKDPCEFFLAHDAGDFRRLIADADLRFGLGVD